MRPWISGSGWNASTSTLGWSYGAPELPVWMMGWSVTTVYVCASLGWKDSIPRLTPSGILSTNPAYARLNINEGNPVTTRNSWCLTKYHFALRVSPCRGCLSSTNWSKRLMRWWTSFWLHPKCWWWTAESVTKARITWCSSWWRDASTRSCSRSSWR